MKAKQVNYYQNVRQEMLELLPSEMKVRKAADIGCGEGYFGLALKEITGAEVWGVELETAAARVATKRLDKVINSSIEDALAKMPANSFDVIYCNDVLEHLYDPEDIVHKLKSKLKKGGLLISSIPNVRYFHTFIGLSLGREWEYTHDGVLDFTHLRFFTDKSIVNMFERAGYEIVSQKGINPTTAISMKFKILNVLLKRKFDDTQYIQFATIAKKS